MLAGWCNDLVKFSRSRTPIQIKFNNPKHNLLSQAVYSTIKLSDTPFLCLSLNIFTTIWGQQDANFCFTVATFLMIQTLNTFQYSFHIIYVYVYLKYHQTELGMTNPQSKTVTAGKSYFYLFGVNSYIIYIWVNEENKKVHIGISIKINRYFLFYNSCFYYS